MQTYSGLNPVQQNTNGCSAMTVYTVKGSGFEVDRGRSKCLKQKVQSEFTCILTFLEIKIHFGEPVVIFKHLPVV